MTNRFAAVVFCLPLLLGIDLLRSKSRPIEEGNAALKAGKADQALERYDQAARELPNDPGVRFDRGTALYGLGRFDEAAQEFLRATEAKPPALKATAFYNLGNSFYQAKKYGEAIEAYKRSLALSPSDSRAKWNLELALKQKQEEQKKQDQQKSDQKKQDQKKDDQSKQDQQKPQDQQAKQDPKPDDKDAPKPGQDQQQKQDQKDPQAKDDAQDQPTAPKPAADKDQSKDKRAPQAADEGQAGEPPPADMREIEAVLDSLERSPKALEQERARVRAVRRRPPERDW